MKKLTNLNLKENTTDIKNPTKIFSIILVIAVIVLLSIFLYLNYSVSLKKERVIAEKGAMNQELLKQKSLTEMNRDLSFVYDTNDFFNSLYIDMDNVVSFVVYLEEIAQKANVGINIVSIEEIVLGNQDDGNIKNVQLDIVLKTTGSWNEIQNHLVMMENLPNFIDIKSLKINKIGGTQEQFGADYKISVIAK